jgi:hypothetical protein
MIVPVSAQALAVAPVTALRTRRPAPSEVQGVVVNPPRDSRVAVRVEVVTEGESQLRAAARDRDAPVYAYAQEAALLASNLEASGTTAKLGSPDSRRAAAAYTAHAAFRQYDVPGQRDEPQFIDVRA